MTVASLPESPKKAKGRKESPFESGDAWRTERKRGSGALATLITIVIFCVVLAAGGWWFMRSGFLPTPGNNSAAVSETVAAEDSKALRNGHRYSPRKGAGGLTAGTTGAQWKASSLTACPQCASAHRRRGDAGAVAITLPPTVTRMLADGPVLIEATVLAPNGAAQPVGIYCADGPWKGASGIVSPHRLTRITSLYALEPNGGTTPSRLLISSDLDGGGEPLDILQFAPSAPAEKGKKLHMPARHGISLSQKPCIPQF